MARAIRVNALGTAFEISLDPSVPEQAALDIIDSWSGAADLGEGSVEQISVSGEASTSALISASAPENIGQVLSTVVTQRALSHAKRTHLLLHASGIARGDGRVIAFVGPSGMGKTTLVRHLGKVYGYVSDETVAISSEVETIGRVLPYRKPLSVVVPNGPKTQIAPRALGLQDLPPGALDISAIVLLDRKAEEHSDGGSVETTSPSIEWLGLADSVCLLAPHVSHLSQMESPLESLAEIAALTGGVRRLRYVEASHVEILLDEIEDGSDGNVSPIFDQATWEAGTIDGPMSVFDSNGGDDQAASFDWSQQCDDIKVFWAAVPGTQWLQLESSVITLSGHRISRLEGIGPALWRRLLGATLPTERDFLEAALAEFGAPASVDPVSAVRGGLDQLMAAELIVPVFDKVLDY